MENIVLFGNKHDKSLTNTICRALNSFSKTFKQNNDHSFKIITKNNKFLKLIECDEIPQLQNHSGILVFKDSFFNYKNKSSLNNFTSIISSQNINAVSFLKNTNTITITCGTSSKDTLSIASLDFLSATVSLQRDIKSIYNSTIEAHEFLVDLKQETGVYPILASCAILLLCDISYEKYNF